LTDKINQLILLPNIFNVKNSVRPIQLLKEIPLNADTKLAPLDISNMYSNIPTAETRNILNDIVEVNMPNTDIKYELLT
jgi:hypothetical protein